jgi:hypothetical protein
MRTAHTLILISIMILAGCATAPKTNRLSLGITKQQVIAVMGSPNSTAAHIAGVEILRYRLSATNHDVFHRRTEEYFVRLVGGKVDSYGKMGDFDSEKDLTRKLNSENR